MKYQPASLVVKKNIGKNYKTDIFSLENTTPQVQCAGCNVFRYGEQYIFSQRLDQKYGDGTSEDLQIKARQIVKFQTFELEELILKYKNLVG